MKTKSKKGCRHGRKDRSVDCREIERRTKLAGYTWKTKDGRVLTPKDFVDSHLANSLRMLQRKASPYPPAEDRSWRVAHSPLIEEAARRGLQWEVRAGTQCEWRNGLNGCTELAVMLTPQAPFTPLCEEHRSETKENIPCGGCLKIKPIVMQAGRDFYCAECCTPLGWYAWLLLYLTILFSRRHW